MITYKNKGSYGEINVLFCEKESPPPGSRFGPAIRSAYIVECNVSGYGTITVGGRTFPITPGDCFVLLPGTTVVYTTDERSPRSGYWCYVDGLPLERYFKSAGITVQNPFVSRGAFEEIRKWMIQMVESWEREDAGARLLQTACVYGILSAINKGQRAMAKEYPIEKAMGLMETSYAEELNITELAAQVGMARAYFSTRFKEETGLTPHSYLTQLRIQKACLLLESNEDISVGQIAELVGADPKNFSRQFKQHTGKTPLQYKKTHKTSDGV